MANEPAEKPCTKCGGTGSYSYDENHVKVCEACCPHDQGWWLLKAHYGENNGKYCCKRGCGETRIPEELGVHVPEFVARSEPTEKPSDLDGLVERLESRVLWAFAGVIGSRKGLPIYNHVNPDGPEAAAAIRSLQARCAELEAENGRLREALKKVAYENCEYTTGENHARAIWIAREALNTEGTNNGN